MAAALCLTAAAQTARVQVIHNSADAAAAVVDVYVNGGATPAINDFAFRTATPFIDLPAGVDLEIGIAPGNSTGPQDIIPGLTVSFPKVRPLITGGEVILGPAGPRITLAGQGLLSTPSSHEKEQVHRTPDRRHPKAA